MVPATHLVIIMDKSEIVGGHYSELYPKSGCGLLSYFVVNEKYRGQGIGSFLIQDCVECMHGWFGVI